MEIEMENVNWFLPYGWEKLPKGELAILLLEAMTALNEQETIVERAESEVARLDRELAKAKINLSEARYFLAALRSESIHELQARYKEL